MNVNRSKPAIVFPFHNPEGTMFGHLEAITPVLKQIFAQAYPSITPITSSNHPKSVSRLQDDPSIQSPDMSVMAELVLHCQDGVHTLDVDWLAREDPFILGCDPAALKQEREDSIQETQKRLSYVLPMVERIIEYSTKAFDFSQM